MLSMKTLRVAIVTMGSALLLGPGLAVAQDNINLDGTVAGMDAPAPLTYANETLGAADAMGRRALELENALRVFVEPRRAIGTTEEVYLRIDLSGAQFGTVPGSVAGADVGAASASGTLNSGGAGMTFAVFRLAGVVANGVVGVEIGTGTSVADGGDIRVTASSGNVTATIAAYTDPDDALDEVGARSTFGGSGAILRLVSGLTVTIKATDSNQVASVDHGFIRFLSDAGPTGQVPLGWLGIEENVAALADGGVRNAADGTVLEAGEILRADGTEPDGTISFNIMGNLDIGAFTVKAETFLDANDDGTPDLDEDGNRTPTGTCDGVAEGGDPDRGTLVDAQGMMLIGEDGELPSGVTAASTPALPPGIKLVCLNVDVTGPMSNMSAIPESDYTATAHFKPGLNSLEASQMAGMEGDLASIERNGASVDIPYLTTSEKHNQRLIVVNRGTRPVAITSITFTSEDGTDVELSATAQAAMDAGLLMVPGNSTYVARMDETIVITGDSRRTAASIAFAATPGHLSVATTQVNVSDGSTDTVVYMVD